jgi:hypothetical protein
MYDKSTGEVTLIDWGLGTEYGQKPDHANQTYAPHAVKGEKASSKFDILSLGLVILYDIFPACRSDEHSIKSNYNIGLQNMLARMNSQNPAQRPSLSVVHCFADLAHCCPICFL